MILAAIITLSIVSLYCFAAVIFMAHRLTRLEKFAEWATTELGGEPKEER